MTQATNLAQIEIERARRERERVYKNGGRERERVLFGSKLERRQTHSEVEEHGLGGDRVAENT